MTTTLTPDTYTQALYSLHTLQDNPILITNDEQLTEYDELVRAVQAYEQANFPHTAHVHEYCERSAHLKNIRCESFMVLDEREHAFVYGAISILTNQHVDITPEISELVETITRYQVFTTFRSHSNEPLGDQEIVDFIRFLRKDESSHSLTREVIEQMPPRQIRDALHILNFTQA